MFQPTKKKVPRHLFSLPIYSSPFLITRIGCLACLVIVCRRSTLCFILLLPKIYRLLYSTFHSQWLSSGVKESCYGLSCASRSRIPFSCLLLVSKGCVFRITLHINAFAIADDSVRYSPFLIIITSVCIPVSLCLHSMCWCARWVSSDVLVCCWLSSPFTLHYQPSFTCSVVLIFPFYTLCRVRQLPWVRLD